MTSRPERYTRTPYLVVQRDEQQRRDVYGSVGDAIVIRAQQMKRSQQARTAIVTTHPVGSPAYLPIFSGLAKAGFDVIAADNRYANGDAALQMENVLLDLGALVRDTKERLGYEQVVLGGWSGGAALMMGYQAEAEHPRIVTTAAGEDTPLARTSLTAADGVLLMAPHRSRHHLITDFLDPAIEDEDRPHERNATLDLYSADRTKPPFSADFLVEYRAAQLARNRRISQRAWEMLAGIRASDQPSAEHCFVVDGTMADPRWLDLAIDPNDRAPGSYLGDPYLANHGPAGLARFTTTRSWLSQWSIDDAHIDSIDAAACVSVPVLVIENARDDACPPTHPRAIFEALSPSQAEYYVVEGADHYFGGSGQHAPLADATTRVTEWMDEHDFSD